MEILDYITIAVFAAGIMFVGSLFSSTGKNMKSFFAGGGNVPWWISGLSLFMGFFSAGTFVVWGSIAYSMGFVAVTIQLTMAAAGFAVGLLIAPRWNKTGCLTAAEYITRRYGASTQKLYTYIFLFISIFTTGSFLYPIAKIIEVAAGIPLSSSILILGVFCMIYVSLGGLRAVVVTDVLQFIILFAAVIIVIPLAFGEVGGVPEFLARVPGGILHALRGRIQLGVHRRVHALQPLLSGRKLGLRPAIYERAHAQRREKGRRAVRRAVYLQSDPVDAAADDLPRLRTRTFGA